MGLWFFHSFSNPLYACTTPRNRQKEIFQHNFAYRTHSGDQPVEVTAWETRLSWMLSLLRYFVACGAAVGAGVTTDLGWLRPVQKRLSYRPGGIATFAGRQIPVVSVSLSRSGAKLLQPCRKGRCKSLSSLCRFGGLRGGLCCPRQPNQVQQCR